MIQETIKLGPIDLALPGAMQLTLGMRGDRIETVETTFGYLSRSIENTCVGNPIAHAQLKFSRIDPENSMILDRLFSEAVEQITKTPVSDRARWIRDITTEISELNGFLRYLSKMSHRFGIDVLTHIILKHREPLLDLVELLTGSRYGYYYIMPGGVRYDLTEGFQERLEKWTKNFSSDYQRIQEMFLWTHSFHNRLRSLGRVVDTGDFGFVSESSIETTRHGLVSNVESRLVFALERTMKICGELRELLTERADGTSLHPLGSARTLQTVHSEIETERGVWSLNLSLDPELNVNEVLTNLPSDLVVGAIPHALEGEYFEDVPVILESLYFSIPELDR